MNKEQMPGSSLAFVNILRGGRQHPSFQGFLFFPLARLTTAFLITLLELLMTIIIPLYALETNELIELLCIKEFGDPPQSVARGSPKLQHFTIFGFTAWDFVFFSFQDTRSSI